MASAMETKLMTLLNVSAIKKPKALDLPGGQRGSPSLGSSSKAEQLPNGSPATQKQRNRKTSSTPNGKGVVNGSTETPGGGASPRPLKKRKSVSFSAQLIIPGSAKKSEVTEKGKGKAVPNGSSAHRNGGSVSDGGDLMADLEDNDDQSTEDAFNLYYSAEPSVLKPEAITASDEDRWTSNEATLPGLGKVDVFSVDGEGAASSSSIKNRMTPSILARLKEERLSDAVSQSITNLGSYKDFYLHSMDGEADGSEKALYGDQKEAMRKAVVVHALNHVLKTRRRIIRNNEKLSHSSANSESIDPPRDSSFTRPKVLLLFPLRSLALHYITAHLLPLAPEGTQIENLRPFTSSFSLPSDLEDPLASPSALSNYPLDHVVNLGGNSDDNFRFGIKITRKAWRIVMMPANQEKLLDCDFIIASPLGMKMQADKEGNMDLLSSIEVAVVDGVDVMQMQNWDHVQFIFDHLNRIPDDPHGADFSRIKPWYLDSQAQYLRQTILLSRYDLPEARSVFHKQCHNVKGKIRIASPNLPGVMDRVKFGLRQVFEKIDLEDGKNMDAEAATKELDKRFEWFTKKTIPALLKSAMMRQNTLIVVPSYFDFVRLENYLRKAENISYTAISEYSSNSEISRARTEFFKGKKSFLMITERFHFYRRYRIRGAKNLVFYSLPEHAQFYSEFLETPFLPSQNPKKRKSNALMIGDGEDEEEEVDPGEISCRVLFSRFDILKLERVVGSVNARLMVGKQEVKFQYI